MTETETAIETVTEAETAIETVTETETAIETVTETAIEIETETETEAAPPPEEEPAMEAGEEQEVDRDSLVPGTGSINGDLDDISAQESDIGEEDVTEEDENMSNVVQGTTETILNKLEENLASVPEIDESELLQVRTEIVFVSRANSELTVPR